MPDVRVKYHGTEYKVVLGPPVLVEQRNGALMGTGMPTIDLADPVTGERRVGLTVDIPQAPLKPNQVLVGGREEGLRALTEAGVVRHTGEYYRSREFGATFAVCDFLGMPERQKTTLANLREAAGRQQDRPQQKQKGHEFDLER
jgi:hypothetical protein